MGCSDAYVEMSVAMNAAHASEGPWKFAVAGDTRSNHDDHAKGITHA